MSTSTKLRVAICGGGISGLCLAVALSRYQHVELTLYEATERFKEIGAGVMIWSRTWHILALMGLAPDFSRVAHAPPDGSMGVGFDFRRSDQPHEGFQFRLVEMPYGCIRFHRAEFLDIFVDHLPGGIAQFGKRLSSYSQSKPNDSIHLNFADGSEAVCDLLVGCDGVKSTIRAQMFRSYAGATARPELLEYVEPIWTGITAYRGLIRVDDIPKSLNNSPHRAIQTPMMYCGKSKHVVSYSISQGDIVNVVTFASEPQNFGAPFHDEWVTECSQKELLDCYANWEPEVEDLLKCISHPTRWAIHQLNPLPFYVSGRVVLVGDSAHAMAPHQGAGAGQAIEDAFVLAQILALTTPENLSAALKAYESVRLPAANNVLKGSYESGTMYEFDSSFGDAYETLGPAIQKQWDWIDQPTLEEEIQQAVSIFRELSQAGIVEVGLDAHHT